MKSGTGCSQFSPVCTSYQFGTNYACYDTTLNSSSCISVEGIMKTTVETGSPYCWLPKATNSAQCHATSGETYTICGNVQQALFGIAAQN